VALTNLDILSLWYKETIYKYDYDHIQTTKNHL